MPITELTDLQQQISVVEIQSQYLKKVQNYKGDDLKKYIEKTQTVRTRQNMLGQKLRATKVTKAIREIREILGIPDRRGNQEQTERTGSA